MIDFTRKSLTQSINRSNAKKDLALFRTIASPLQGCTLFEFLNRTSKTILQLSKKSTGLENSYLTNFHCFIVEQASRDGMFHEDSKKMKTFKYVTHARVVQAA